MIPAPHPSIRRKIGITGQRDPAGDAACGMALPARRCVTAIRH